MLVSSMPILNVLNWMQSDVIEFKWWKICGALRVLQYTPPIKLIAIIHMCIWNIVENGAKTNNSNYQSHLIFF